VGGVVFGTGVTRALSHVVGRELVLVVEALAIRNILPFRQNVFKSDFRLERNAKFRM